MERNNQDIGRLSRRTSQRRPEVEKAVDGAQEPNRCEMNFRSRDRGKAKFGCASQQILRLCGLSLLSFEVMVAQLLGMKKSTRLVDWTIRTIQERPFRTCKEAFTMPTVLICYFHRCQASTAVTALAWTRSWISLADDSEPQLRPHAYHRPPTLPSAPSQSQSAVWSALAAI